METADLNELLADRGAAVEKANFESIIKDLKQSRPISISPQVSHQPSQSSFSSVLLIGVFVLLFVCALVWWHRKTKKRKLEATRLLKKMELDIPTEIKSPPEKPPNPPVTPPTKTVPKPANKVKPKMGNLTAKPVPASANPKQTRQQSKATVKPRTPTPNPNSRNIPKRQAASLASRKKSVEPPQDDDFTLLSDLLR